MKNKIGMIVAMAVMGVGYNGLLSPSANAMTEVQKQRVNEAVSITQAQLNQRIERYRQEQTSLAEMKDDLVADLKRLGMDEDQAVALASRFQTEDEVISSLKKAADQAALAGWLIFANVRYFDSFDPSQTYLPVQIVAEVLSFVADVFLVPFTFSADVSNHMFESNNRHTKFGFLTGLVQRKREDSLASDARASWSTLATVPLDLVLFPVYLGITIVDYTIEVAKGR